MAVCSVCRHLLISCFFSLPFCFCILIFPSSFLAFFFRLESSLLLHSCFSLHASFFFLASGVLHSPSKLFTFSHSFSHSFACLFVPGTRSFIHSFTHSFLNCLHLPLYCPINGSSPATTIAIHLHSQQAKPPFHVRFHYASCTAPPPTSRRGASRELAFFRGFVPLQQTNWEQSSPPPAPCYLSSRRYSQPQRVRSQTVSLSGQGE